MSKQIIIAEQHRIAAVFSEEQIQELIVAKGSHQVSDIYFGIVENVLPGIDAAFVNIGDSERNGFIHVSDLGPLRLKKSMGAITELLAPQQKVLVQVMKEPTGSKGPRLTGNISLPGRYLVLMPYGRGVNLSRRIRNESERNRLRALAVLIKPAGMGLVVRTEAESMAEEAIIEDLESLQKQWELIQEEANTTRAPALLNRDDDFIQRVLRDTFNADVNRIVVDAHPGLKRVKQHLMAWSAGRLPQGVLIDHHKESIPILEYFRVNAAIREALKPRVDLPSGGYVIIQPTEALTVVDVNSGSFTRSATSRETVLWTNYEAATEIARQMRLRNIAGVIIVDFIDMESRRDQLQLLEHFNKALRADKSRPQIAQLTELGLVELTRKRQGQNIYELFGRACPTCSGLGHLVCLPGQEQSLTSLVSPLSAESLNLGSDYPVAGDGSASLADPMSNGRTRGRLSSARGEQRRLGGNAPPARGGRWSGRAEPIRPEGLPSFESETSEPDFLNHPSYNDRGAGSRRRRRRVPGSDMGRPTPLESREPETLESDVPLDWDLRETTPEPERLPTVPVSNETTRPEGRKGRSERGRSSRRGGNLGEGRPDGSLVKTPPKEVITVEMTPEEQEVFAWMGINPLVFANQEVKNPRSVVVAVTLPGEIPDLSDISEPGTGFRGADRRSFTEAGEAFEDTNPNDDYGDSALTAAAFSLAPEPLPWPTPPLGVSHPNPTHPTFTQPNPVTMLEVPSATITTPDTTAAIANADPQLLTGEDAHADSSNDSARRRRRRSSATSVDSP